MKHLRKIMALVLSLAMVLAMSITVFATEGATTSTTGKFTITAPAGNHQYEIYQIFTGDLKDKTLSNIKWGINGKETKGSAVSETVLNDLKTVAEENKTDRDKIDVVTKYADLKKNPVSTITDGANYEAAPGYYLIKDADNSITGDDAYTTYLVKVVGAVTIQPKSAKPSVDKQVLDETGDAEAGAANGWGESADHAINESFQFKLIATIPDDKDMDAYDHYYLNFEDVMGKGVTFEKIDSVTVTSKDSTEKVLDNTQYTLSDNVKLGLKGSVTWNISIIDLKQYLNDIKGAKITVIYSAHLNEEAEVTNTSNTEGTTNNQNKVALEYSNNPNATGDGSSKPNDRGKTEYDYVFVLTYESDNTKYKNEISEDNLLAGAGFRLYSDENCNNEIPLKKNADGFYYPIATGKGEEMISAGNGQFNIKGLDAGTYYLKETSTPEGLNTIENMKIEINAIHKEKKEDPTKVAVTLTKKLNDKEYTGANNVINKSGSILPETGGIGTTIFYIVGVVLVLSAGVLLVTKKRMNADK